MPDRARRAPSPFVLGFDTSAAHCAAAVVSGGPVSGGHVLASRTEPLARGQAERLFPLIEAVLAEAGIGWPDLAAIGVGVGPGNFTGVRIAVAAARGLALSLGVPAHGVSATEAAAGAPRPCRAVVPLRGDEIAWEDFAAGIAQDPAADNVPRPAIMQAGGTHGPLAALGAAGLAMADASGQGMDAAEGGATKAGAGGVGVGMAEREGPPADPEATGGSGADAVEAAEAGAEGRDAAEATMGGRAGVAGASMAGAAMEAAGAEAAGAAGAGAAEAGAAEAGAAEADAAEAAAHPAGAAGGPEVGPAAAHPAVQPTAPLAAGGPRIGRIGSLPPGPAPLVPPWPVAVGVALVAAGRLARALPAARPTPLYLRPADAAPPRDPAPMILP